MRSRVVRRCALVAAACVLSAVPGAAQQDAAELVARVMAGQQTDGYSLRARLVTTVRGEQGESIVQVRALGRRDGSTTRTMYQALYPAGMKGQAVSFETEAGRVVSGFLFQPPEATTQLSPGNARTALFGSELTVEDLVEDFWNWPDPSGAGPAVVNGQRCQVVELHPPPGTRTDYALVRSCISAERALPLLIEKLDAGGKTLRRFRIEKSVKRDGRWAPSRLAIENPVTGRTTVVEVSRANGDIAVPLADFSVENIKRMR
jgi:hypothetical protein